MFGAFALFVFPNFLFAQTAKEIFKSPDWTKATVVTDGGAVYSQTDFDSSVNEYLGHGAKVWVLKKATTGTGGLGLFHKVRFKNKSGYMADTDIRIVGKPGEKQGSKEAADNDKPEGKKDPENPLGSKAWDPEEEERKGPKPLYFTRHVGGALAMIKYTEKFSHQRLSSQVPMAGMRLTGPEVLLAPPFDVNILFTPFKPGYYSRVTDKSVKGFMLFGDAMVVLPIVNLSRTVVYYGFGMMWTYTNYKVEVKNSHFDSQEFRIGADIGLGSAFRLGKNLAIRFDAKYFIEKTQYYGLITSLQTEM